MQGSIWLKSWKFISLNKFTNKDTWEVSFNIDVQFVYWTWEKEFKKIEKLYLNNVELDFIKELETLKMWDDLMINSVLTI